MTPPVPPEHTVKPTAVPGTISPKWSLALLTLAYVGAFKGNRAFAAAPIDLTIFAAVVVALAIVIYFLRGGRVTRAVYPILLLWAAFVPGVVLSWPTGQGSAKTAMLFTITLLVAVTTPLILQTQRSRRYWLFSIVGFAVLVLFFAMIDPSIVESQEYGRLSLEGGTTIVSGQLIGAGSVVALLGALRPGQRGRALLAGLAAMLALGVLLVGSRGPFFAMLFALTATLTLGRVYARSRVIIVGAWVAMASGLLWFVFSTDMRPVARIVDFVATQKDPAREWYYSVAGASIGSQPQGVGWGGFAYLVGMGSAESSGIPVYPHNLFLEVALEGGWLAGLALMAFVSVALTRLWRRSLQPDGVALFGLAIYWLVAAQTSSDINGNRMMWASLAVAFIVRDIGDGVRGDGQIGDLHARAVSN